MKHLAPAYYGAFTCLADRCRDNCCIGWEIGIDPDTAAFYDRSRRNRRLAAQRHHSAGH